MREPTLIFLHIPKTAGSTLGHPLHRQYQSLLTFLINGNFPELSVQEFIALPQEQRNRYQCISGHIPFGLHDYIQGQILYVTMLREPVRRVISLYYHMLRETTHYMHQAAVSQKLCLLDFVNSGLSRELYNDQTRIISGIGDWNQKTDKTMVDETAFKKAISNIEEYFPVVGLTEMFDESLLLMKDAFSWNSVLYSNRKVAYSRSGQTTIDSRTLDAIKNQNQYDILLYEYVKRRLQKQVENGGSRFHNRVRMFRNVNRVYNLVRNYKRAPAISMIWNAAVRMAKFWELQQGG